MSWLKTATYKLEAPKAELLSYLEDGHFDHKLVTRYLHQYIINGSCTLSDLKRYIDSIPDESAGLEKTANIWSGFIKIWKQKIGSTYVL